MLGTGSDQWRHSRIAGSEVKPFSEDIHETFLKERFARSDVGIDFGKKIRAVWPCFWLL
jgi:hypothetical protein